jgi:hypothetical protein
MNCLVDDMYKLAAEAERSGSNQVIHLPRRVATESSILGALAPIIVTNIATEYAPTIFASDASLSKGAVVSGDASAEVSKVVWLGSDKKRGPGRVHQAC